MHYSTYQEAIADLEKYPYFAYAAICAARLAPDPDEAERLLMLARLNTGGTEAAAPAGDEHGEATHRVPTPATSDAIDAFLSRYAANSGRDLPPLPYSPGEPLSEETDAGSADTDKAPADDHSDNDPQAKARDLIKNRKYAEALAIIEALNLNNPEKSIYFADQIRFLKKLILIQTKSNG